MSHQKTTTDALYEILWMHPGADTSKVLPHLTGDERAKLSDDVRMRRGEARLFDEMSFPGRAGGCRILAWSSVANAVRANAERAAKNHSMGVGVRTDQCDHYFFGSRCVKALGHLDRHSWFEASLTQSIRLLAEGETVEVAGEAS